ncbi:hypothetical protein CWE15_02460 [Aliidiomarina taiwanensis]|uniref:DNA-directed DNA polymerase n=1 Tax=Aliidiomarina taiwanensis TaxID=946228 RepID=A0A432X9J5_9GAMM|nr:hypothetical protein [Aliidiomarina taiwanensis]RUO44057.1 hypothetical protein CWE15_02460 [Aliidiomarina taiwanensis]
MAKLDYPWLASLWRQWLQAKQQQGLPHALGIPWQPHAGSEALLEALVAWLLCQQPASKACGQCKSCLLQQAGNHPDLLWVQPEEGKKIGVDRIRDLQNKVWQHASQGGATVIVIEKAEQMTEAAANALLKTLEEPPAHNYLIICPERFSRLLPTVRSRLTVYPLPKPSLTEVQDWLQRHTETRIDNADLLSEAQVQPVAVLKRIQSGQEQPEEDILAVFQGQLLELPDKAPEQLAWLDTFLLSLVRGMRAAQRLELNEQPPADAWGQFLVQVPQVANLLPVWYDRALDIKRQLQGSGVNGKHLIQQLLSTMYMNSIQVKVE